MNYFIRNHNFHLLALLATVLTWPVIGHSQEPNTETSWEEEVKECSKAFAKAYNAADADALASLFVETGEFIDSERNIYQGMDAIRAEFNAMFEQSSNYQIVSSIDLVRKIAPGVAIEDGRAAVSRGEDSSEVLVTYSVVYVKSGDTWKIGSLRDHKSEFATPGDRLYVLQWLIGDWVHESDEGVSERSYYWSEDGNYILGDYVFLVDGVLETSGTMRIGWDPASRQIKTWVFDAEGGQIEGIWEPVESGWRVMLKGARADGESGTAINFYEPVADDKVMWKTTDRMIAGEALPDVEMTMVRRPPAPKVGTNSEQKEKSSVED